MAEQALLLASGLSVGLLFLLLLLLLLLLLCYRWRKRKREQGQYEELPPTLPSVPACSAPVILVSQCSWTMPSEIPFELPPRLSTLKRDDLQTEERDQVEMKPEPQQDLLAHRGSLSVRSWFPVGTVAAGLYSSPPLNQVVAPPPGMATRLCFSVEYRHSGEQLTVAMFRLANLPPRFHSNVTLVELRLLPDDRRPRLAKARGTGPDPEFNDCFIFQVSGVCVPRSTLSVCVVSVEPDGKRHPVGRVLLPLEGELGRAGRVLWRDLDAEDDTVCSELGDVQISLSYSPTLQRLSVVVLRARGLQLLSDTNTHFCQGVCVQVSLQIHARVVKVKRSGVARGESDPRFDHRMTFKLRSQHLDEACLSLEVQRLQDDMDAESWVVEHGLASVVFSLRTAGGGRESVQSPDAPVVLGTLLLGPFMYAKGPQLQHWMDMVNTPQEAVEQWHRLSRAS